MMFECDGPEKGTQQNMRWFGKIAQKSVDYVICKKDMTVTLAIELDDGSHKGREQADADKSKALEDAGVTLIRWHVKGMPDVEQIKRQVAEVLMAQRQQQAQHETLA